MEDLRHAENSKKMYIYFEKHHSYFHFEEGFSNLLRSSFVLLGCAGHVECWGVIIQPEGGLMHFTLTTFSCLLEFCDSLV